MQAMIGPNEPDDPPPEHERPDLTGADPAAVFGELFDLYARPLHQYLARRIGSDTAHDLVSETFLTALRRRDSYRPDAGTVRSWLYGIATNLLRHHRRTELRALRATARLAGTVETVTSGPEPRVVDRVDAQTRAAQLAGALARLSTADRDTLLLVSWAGLSMAEAADTLGIPLGTVQSRLHRTRRWLRINTSHPQPARQATGHRR